MKNWRSILIPVLCTALALLVFRTVLIIGYVPSKSMEPTIHKNSFVLGLRLYGELKTGDVIIFRHGGKLLVKRIAAVGGETVIHNGEEVIVPNDCFYVLGDNAENSLDSRFWENPFVSREDVVGKWNTNKRGRLWEDRELSDPRSGISGNGPAAAGQVRYDAEELPAGAF